MPTLRFRTMSSAILSLSVAMAPPFASSQALSCAALPLPLHSTPMLLAAWVIEGADESSTVYWTSSGALSFW